MSMASYSSFSSDDDDDDGAPPPPSLLTLLPDPVIERALSYLPLPCLVSASAACKLLHELVWSAGFARVYELADASRSPWLLVVGVNRLVPGRSQCWGYEPASGVWVRMAWPEPEPGPGPGTGPLAATGEGFVFALAGARQDRVRMARPGAGAGAWEWEEMEEAMAVPRRQPIVAAIAGTGNRKWAVVAGGEEAGEEWEVEVYETGGWRRGPPLPIREPAGSLTWAVSPAGRLFVADRYSGRICRLDADAGRWAAAEALRPAAARCWDLAPGPSALGLLAAVVVCMCGSGGHSPITSTDNSTTKQQQQQQQLGLKLVALDEDTMRVSRELSTMPPHLFRMLLRSSHHAHPTDAAADAGDGDGDGDDGDDDDDDKHLSLRCCAAPGGTGVIYIYSTSKFALRRPVVVVMCKIKPRPAPPPPPPTDGGPAFCCSCTWDILPPLPPTVNRFDHVLCLSSHVPLSSPTLLRPPQ